MTLHVTHLWRYPVKTLAGESLSSAAIGQNEWPGVDASSTIRFGVELPGGECPGQVGPANSCRRREICAE